MPRPLPREPLYEPRVMNLGYVILALTMVTPISVLAMIVLRSFMPGASTLPIVVLLPGAAFALLGAFLWRIHRIRKLIRAHGRFLCLSCHYPLAGLPDQGRCPECDLPYDRATTERRWLSWEKSVNKEKPLA